MKTVAVIEGFAGGPRHTKLLRHSLVQAGYKVIKDAKTADIVVAHSAGIYAIPEVTKAELIVLLDPTYWPGKKLGKRANHLRRQAKEFYTSNYGWTFYIKKKLLEIYYFFVRHKYMWLGILNNNRLDKIERLAEKPGRKIIIVRNQDDSFTSPDINSAIQASNIKFIELPGIHDDLYINPQPYINLIKQAVK